MAYSTPLMVRQALAPGDFAEGQPQIPDLTNTAADFDDTQLNDAIAEADSVIDGYIGAYYKTPVDGAPHPIDYLSRNIAAYNATLSYRKGQDLADQDPVIRRYNGSIAFLTLVSTGKAKLAGIPENSDSTDGSGVVSVGKAFNVNQNPLFGNCVDEFPEPWARFGVNDGFVRNTWQGRVF